MKIAALILLIITLGLALPYTSKTYGLKSISAADLPSDGAWAPLTQGNLYYRWYLPSEAKSNGQTLVLGGIFQTEEVNGTDKVPVLGDIPFLGKLFRNDLRNVEKREILIFITPKIIDDNLLDR